MPVYPAVYRKHLYARTGLTSTEVAVLGALAHLSAVPATAGGWFAATQADIAARAGTTARQVRRLLPALADRGWLEVSRQVRGGRYLPTMYRLALPPPEDMVSASPEDMVSASPEDTVSASPEDMVSASMRTQCPNEYVVTPRGDSDGTAPSGDGADALGRSWLQLPPKRTDTTPLLDELGIRRRRRGA